MTLRRLTLAVLAGAVLPGSLATAQDAAPNTCFIEAVVLGAGQDAGAPQIGNAGDTGPELLPSSLAIVDRNDGARYLFDATPAITAQLAMLDGIAPPGQGPGIDGIFLTHAHIGHHLGLARLGHEAADAKSVPVYAMPRMHAFLTANGPWNQLVEGGNILLQPLEADELVPVSDTFGVWPLAVPHRDEYSETVGFLVMTPGKRTLYMPHVDDWDALEASGEATLADLLAMVDVAYLDATLWDDDELPGRDIRAIPQPYGVATMARLAGLPDAERAKVRFINYNHSNPIRDPTSAQSAMVVESGFGIARGGDRFCLD